MDKIITEKRAFTRFKKSYLATLKIKDSKLSFPCETVDISRGGVSLKLKSRLSNPSVVLLDINPSPGFSGLTTEAQLVWNKTLSDDGFFHYGLHFTGIKEENSLTLRRLFGYKVDHIVTASYLPEQIVTNEDIVEMGFKGSPVALERGLGVKERRAAAKDETNADMLAKVAKEILNKAGILPEELDRIICAADPGDSAAPDTACAVQAKIGAPFSCSAYGVSMSCTGWVAGVDIALQYLATKEKRILVLGSSLVGSRLYYHNLMHRAIFGDGAGGILLESHHLDRFLAIGEIADGRYYSEIFVPYPWSQRPIDVPVEYEGSFYMSPDQKAFFSLLEFYLPKFVKRMLGDAKVKLEDISLFLLHYPSKPLFEHSLKLMGIPRAKTFNNFRRYGNLVAAEMPVFLDEAVKAGRIKKGDLIFILPYGAGVTMGGIIMRY